MRKGLAVGCEFVSNGGYSESMWGNANFSAYGDFIFPQLIGANRV
ncbi:MAG: hypothetical protein ABNH53_10105 [Henriciella sp.]